MAQALEAYLDCLFDLLAGSGARGRRALLEAQAHLEEAIELSVDAGKPIEEAERDALQRFGSPEVVARALMNVGMLPIGAALGRVFAAGWLMASVAGLAVGLMGLIALALASVFGAEFVSEEAGVPFSAELPLNVGAIALVLLGVFLWSRRVPALRGLTQLPNTAMVSAAGAVGFGGIGVVLCAYGLASFVLGERGEVGAHLAEGFACIAASVGFLPFAWRHLRQDRALAI